MTSKVDVWSPHVSTHMNMYPHIYIHLYMNTDKKRQKKPMIFLQASKRLPYQVETMTKAMRPGKFPKNFRCEMGAACPV